MKSAFIRRLVGQSKWLSRERLVEAHFDRQWYLAKNPDVRDAGIDPLRHYLQHGGFEGRDPHPLFSSSYYLKRYPVVGSLHMNPLVHYIAAGAAECYDPHPLISTAHIAAQSGSRKNAFRFYVESVRAGRDVDPHPLFNVGWYRQQCGSVDFTQIDPLTHYINFGAAYGLDPHPLFSTNYYLAQNADVKSRGTNPLAHYIADGADEGRSPHPCFDTGWYRRKYMQESGGTANPLVHFINYGLESDADPHVLFPTKDYRRLFGRDIPANEHPLSWMLRTGHLKFASTTADLDDEATILVGRGELAKKETFDAFVTFNFDAISGGIFSIFSIVAELRAQGRYSQLFSLPGGAPVVRYTRFNNDEIILPFEDLVANLRLRRIKTIHVPEVMLPALQASLKEFAADLELGRVTLNILNQNGELMPDRAVFGELSEMFGRTTMTTAHERYSTASHAEMWNVPIKHLSTYMSYDDYQIKKFDEKKNIIVLSPDRAAGDENVLDHLSSSFGGYNIYRVEAIHYEFYKHCIGWAKFAITFGEGLDNYFIETVFTGGIPFAVYNPIFMPASMKALPNVFVDLQEMKEKISSLIRDIELYPQFREKVHSQNYDLLRKLYDKSIYRRKLSEYLRDEFDVWPREE